MIILIFALASTSVQKFSEETRFLALVSFNVFWEKLKEVARKGAPPAYASAPTIVCNVWGRVFSFNY